MKRNNLGTGAVIALCTFTLLIVMFGVGAKASEREHHGARNHSESEQVDSTESTTSPSVQINFEATPPSEIIASDGTCNNTTSGTPDWDAHDVCLHTLTDEMQDKFAEVSDRFMQATGHKLYIVSAYRSLASQAQIYRECRTFEEIEADAADLKNTTGRPELSLILRTVGRNPDTGNCAQPTQALPGASAHNYGVAWDAYPIKLGQLVSNGSDPLFQTYGRTVIQSGLGWGGNFGTGCNSAGDSALNCANFGNGWDMGHAQEPGFSGTASIRDNRPLYQPENVNVAPTAVVDNFETGLGEFLDQFGIDDNAESRDFDTVDEDTGAIGRWQIPEDNWSTWAQAVGLAADVEPTEDNQRLVMRGQIIHLFSRYGDWQEVANAWFAELVEGNVAPTTTTTTAPSSGVHELNGDVSVDRFLQVLAYQESRGNPTIGAGTSSACGKFQYVHRTWNGNPGQNDGAKYVFPPAAEYAEACDAPEAVQDAVVKIIYERQFESLHGDVFSIALSHFLPAALTDPSRLDRVPSGNVVTPREYANNLIDNINDGTGSDIQLHYSEAPDWDRYAVEAGITP